jgi:hypothetical protein
MFGVPSARSIKTAPFAATAIPRNPHAVARECTECFARAVAQTTMIPASAAAVIAVADRGLIARSEFKSVPSRSVATSRIVTCTMVPSAGSRRESGRT